MLSVLGQPNLSILTRVVEVSVICLLPSHLFLMHCTSQGDLAFGKKGLPASAGRPRIPGDATIVFDVEMVGLPGKEVELIELIGD